jgi:hypothetical protein
MPKMDQRRERFRELRQEGLTYQEISELCGVTRQYVSLLIGNGTVMRPPKKPYPHQRRKPIEERFWSRVDKRSPDECWEWTASRHPTNYGHLSYRGVSLYAHRFAYELTHGPVPDGLYVCHRCDNPPCCNPAHLFAGTPSENTQDAIAKKRWKPGGKPMAAR